MGGGVTGKAFVRAQRTVKNFFPLADEAAQVGGLRSLIHIAWGSSTLAEGRKHRGLKGWLMQWRKAGVMRAQEWRLTSEEGRRCRLFEC